MNYKPSTLKQFLTDER